MIKMKNEQRWAEDVVDYLLSLPELLLLRSQTEEDRSLGFFSGFCVYLVFFFH